MTTNPEDLAELACLAVDIVLLAEHDGEPHVLMIHRRWDPFQGRKALPGGLVDVGEAIADAAWRELREETALGPDYGLDGVELSLLGFYDTPGRDPRARVISFAYIALLTAMPEPVAGDDARYAKWDRLHELLANPDRLAFDHHRILLDAERRMFPAQGR